MPAVSANGVKFTAGFEGFASRAYRCPAGVITIGYGFTMGSRVFAEWWRAKYGRALQMGDTMSREDADVVLAKLLNEEYGAAVDTRIGALPQHQKDGATSTSFNCGIGALAWKWAQALKRGAVSESADLLRNTAVTAAGKRLAGLVRRREAEATLISTGNYGAIIITDITKSAPPSQSTLPQDVRWYQDALKQLGYPVVVSGDPKTSAAQVVLFQQANGLLDDGKVGPATRAALIRALDAKKANKRSVGSGTVAGGADVVGQSKTTPPAPVDAHGNAADSLIDPAMAIEAIGVVIVVALIAWGCFWLWRNRGRFTGARVPT